MITVVMVTQKILELCQIDSEIASQAGIYARPMVFALLFSGFFDIQRRFLCALSKSYVPMICQGVCVCI